MIETCGVEQVENLAGECIGCYADDSRFITRNEFSITDMKIKSPAMTPQLCIKHCYGLSQARKFY